LGGVDRACVGSVRDVNLGRVIVRDVDGGVWFGGCRWLPVELSRLSSRPEWRMWVWWLVWFGGAVCWGWVLGFWFECVGVS